jgi:RNA polymerase sigma-70 factor, ECF subfamily
MSDTDRRLLDRTAAGDSTAFDEFILRHEAAVLRFLRGVTSDQTAAEDAFQETFVSAWRAAATYRGAGSARGWLLAIARNAVFRGFRRRAGEPATLESLEDLAVEAGWGRNPGEELATRLEQRHLIQRAFRKLSPEEREILILREVEGFTGEEVAEMLSLTVAAAKSRLHRARLRLTASLRGEPNART